MADRKERIQIFEDTIKRCDTDQQLNRSVQASLAGQRIYWENEDLSPDLKKLYGTTELELSRERTCEAAKRFNGKRVCILNFASFVTPGGGVTRGTTAQEESICRISTLYKCIADESAKAFYDSHWELINNSRIDRRNNDDIIFTPGVTVFKADTFDCELLPENEWHDIDVITCAAPDLRYDYSGKTFNPTDAELQAVHEQRCRRILTVAAMHNAEIVILGAFGCGAFENRPGAVAKAAENVCGEFDGVFDKIVFAVYTSSFDSDNYRAFSAINNVKQNVVLK